MKLEKAMTLAAGGLVASMSVAAAVIQVSDVIKNGDKPAAPAIGPNGTDVIVGKDGTFYIVRPTVPRF